MTLKAMKRKDITRVGLAILLLLFPLSKTEAQHSSPYITIKNNLLYDILLIPNLGADIYVGRNWSVSANWMYAWWHNDNRHRYWRVYGGDAGIRYWFGTKAHSKPLTGHHVGLYGQMLTYDFEWGKRGYLGDKWSYGIGLEYGYSMPLSERFNLDFSIGAGYLGGQYKEYLPMDGHYVWQSTKNRRWFGPTKAEVSIVWLLGKENKNKKR